MVHNSCNMGTCGWPDIYTLRPVALVLWVYTSGKPLVPMLLVLSGIRNLKLVRFFKLALRYDYSIVVTANLAFTMQ